MHRKNITPRLQWQDRLESQGFYYHTPDGQTYWDETAYYALTEREALTLEKATQELHALCLHAIEVVIKRGWLRQTPYPALVYPSC